MSTPEGRVKSKVRAALTELPATYRFMPVQNGMGAPSLDFICCIAGLFVAIETKVPGKHLTDRQRTTANAIAAAGGMVFVIRDVQDIDHMLTTLHYHLRVRKQQIIGPAGFVYDTLAH